MKILDDYFDLQEQIHDHFGYKEDWSVIQLDDQTGKYWFLNNNCDAMASQVCYSEEPFTEESIEEGKVICTGMIYTQRHLPKWVYRAAEQTMICVDTQCDGNKFLMVFDNDKEVKDETLIDIFNQCW